MVASSTDPQITNSYSPEDSPIERSRWVTLQRLGFPEVAASRLPGVDGLRALAALWVVAFHIGAFSHGRFPQIPGLDLWVRSGSTGVSLFLVLSGFCLYVPFAGARIDRFRTKEFFVRRCRRLLPAYYTSLILVLILNLGAGVWLGFPALSPGAALWQALTHATLIHILFPNTFYALNGAYWSLGLEWQLYLTLPFLILAIRKFGIRPTLLAVVACNIVYGLILGALMRRGVIVQGSVVATVIVPNELFGRWAEFGFGMLAAELYATGQLQNWRRWAPKAKFFIPLLIPMFVVVSLWPGFSGLLGGAGRHIAYGAVFFCLLSLVVASDNIVSRAASWTPLAALGTMSYSLYLVHQPLVQGFAYFARVHAHTSPDQTFLILIALVPFIVFLAWVLFYTVERRTLTSNRRKVAGAAPPPPAVAAPAASAATT
jgi:peptidoglycan/LPS O-acetylase OafA/YrhL